MDQTEDYISHLRDFFLNGTSETYPKNTPILSIDDVARAAYYVATGYVRIYSVNGRGEQYTHIIYGPGEIFPLPWLVQAERSNVLYETLTAANIYCRPITTINNALRNDNTLAIGMLRQSIEQYRVYTMRVDNLEYKYASERLAYRLILLANRFGEHDGTSTTIVPPLTHQLLANSLNLSRESVSREMEKLLHKGLVRYNASRQIILPDIQNLAQQLHVPLHQGLTGVGEASEL